MVYFPMKDLNFCVSHMCILVHVRIDLWGSMKEEHAAFEEQKKKNERVADSVAAVLSPSPPHTVRGTRATQNHRHKFHAILFTKITGSRVFHAQNPSEKVAPSISPN